MNLWESMSGFASGQLSWSSTKALCSLAMSGIFSLVAITSEFAHPSIPFLIALVCIDLLLAVGISLYERRFSCFGFRHGLGKFVGYSLAFIVTSLADKGMAIDGWPLNITVAMSCWAITGETISCLGHIDRIFPNLLPPWIVSRLQSIREGLDQAERQADRGGGENQLAESKDKEE